MFIIHILLRKQPIIDDAQGLGGDLKDALRLSPVFLADSAPVCAGHGDVHRHDEIDVLILDPVESEQDPNLVRGLAIEFLHGLGAVQDYGIGCGTVRVVGDLGRLANLLGRCVIVVR